MADKLTQHIESRLRESLRLFEIPLPPLPEQRRIADILDKADAIRRKRREQIAAARTLSASVFIEIFGDPLGHASSCNLSTLDKVVVSEGGLKRGPFGGALKKEIFVSDGYAVYEQQHAISGTFDIARYYISEDKFAEMAAFAVLPGDLIVSCSGTMGRVAIVPDNAKEGVINQALLRIRPDSSVVTAEYLKCYLDLPQVQARLSGFSRGSGLKNFPPMGDVRALPVPVPTANQLLQFERANAIAVATTRRQHNAVVFENELFDSLVQRAFRGDL